MPSLTFVFVAVLAAAAAACGLPTGEGPAPAAASPRPPRAPEEAAGTATGVAGTVTGVAGAATGVAGAATGVADGDRPGRADPGSAPAAELAASPGCTSDAECGYDPTTGRCAADPRLNRQPPLTDQGIVCYCAAGACALLRVLPVPCEGDHDCAVAHEPRPHPVRATPERPRERGRPCRDFTLSATCERTNICTLRRFTCPAR